MGIAAWICRGCSKEVPLDHFATTPCGETVCHPDYAAAVLADRESQIERSGVRVSHGLGCPRRAAIEATEAYAVDPLTMLAAITGTGWHAVMERAGKPEILVSGVIAGIQVSGKMDSYGDPIGDWKTMGAKAPAEAKPEHVVQLSLYAELCEQSGLRRPRSGIIWYKDPWSIQPRLCSLMTVDEALAVKPYGGEHTVRELFAQASKMFTKDERGSEYEHWSHQPLAGKSMMFGTKSMCDYCAVREQCTVAAMGAPF